MEILINANECDASTVKLAEELRNFFAKVVEALSGNYGGEIEHLWIDIELSEVSVQAWGKPPKPFRYQKRVSGASRMGLPAAPDFFNVGHYSVRPDFEILKQKTIEQRIHYIVGLVYKSTECLFPKQKKLGGFDISAFRNDLMLVCTELGFTISDE